MKVNFPDVLAKQLSGRRKRPVGKVLLGTLTDTYQPTEAHYKITQSSLKVLAAYELDTPLNVVKINYLTEIFENHHHL